MIALCPLEARAIKSPGRFCPSCPGARASARFSNHITWDGGKHVSNTSEGDGDNGDSDDDDSGSDWCVDFRDNIRIRRELATEMADFRFRVLNAAFQALIGTWTPGKWDVVKNDLGLVKDPHGESPEMDQSLIETEVLTFTSQRYSSDQVEGVSGHPGSPDVPVTQASHHPRGREKGSLHCHLTAGDL